jgi:hypothetical protein
MTSGHDKFEVVHGMNDDPTSQAHKEMTEERKPGGGGWSWVVGCWLGMMLVVVSVGLVARFQGGVKKTQPNLNQQREPGMKLSRFPHLTTKSHHWDACMQPL